MPPTCRPLPPRIPESKIATSADSCVQSSGHSCCRASDRPPEERSNQRISEHAQLRARRSNPAFRLRRYGLLRCARNDGPKPATDVSARGNPVTAKINPLAGKPADPSMLVNVPRLVTAYFAGKPDPAVPAQRVAFGTSGHRGSAFNNAFNEAHILAISQAVCDYRRRAGIDGPLFIGIDTHALAESAFASALEVFAANDVTVMIDERDGYTPTPAISHAILTYNRNRTSGLADGVVITPSHNPPEDGGFKYNPPNGGPADTDITTGIERAANAFLEDGLRGLQRISYHRAHKAACVHRYDYVGPYVADLANVIDMEAIRASGVKIGIDPLGGAGVHFWQPIVERYGIAATIVSDTVDPTFRFMTVDWDGKIRMDCSSPYAMARLIGMRDKFDVAFANDTDADRHGIVTRSNGLMNPNHYLAAGIAYLFEHRPGWHKDSAVGKTIVSSAIIDR